VGRVETGFRHRFRTLLARVQPRRLEFGVELLMGRARERSLREGVTPLAALTRLYEETRVKVEKRVALMERCTVAPAVPAAGEGSDNKALRFACDAHLGALARWLRALGYEASWTEGIPDAQLVAEAQASGAVLITGDAGILDRRPVRTQAVRAIWVPSPLDPAEQLVMVVRDLGLERRTPRCMPCGGELRPVAKSDVADRIPPRTKAWKDEYFVCAACGRLFWKGTHWERIAARLQGIGQ
jgi:uncharacterized protein with PIN domain